jgi:hypothetical protein
MNRSFLFKLVVAALLLVASQPSRAAAQAYDITADIPNLSGSYYTTGITGTSQRRSAIRAR